MHRLLMVIYRSRWLSEIAHALYRPQYGVYRHLDGSLFPCRTWWWSRGQFYANYHWCADPFLVEAQVCLVSKATYTLLYEQDAAQHLLPTPDVGTDRLRELFGEEEISF